MKIEDIDTIENVTISDQKFNKLMVQFLLDEPFFASIVINLKKIKTLSIPTAGVTVKDHSIVLYWNPDFVASLTPKKFFGLMKHECYHLIFQHVVSRKQDPHLLWNIATDLAINSLIDEDYLPDGGLIPGKALKSSTEPPVIDAKTQEKAQSISDFIAKLPKFKSAEWYMSKLLEDPDTKENIEKVFGNGSGEDCGFDVHIDPDSSMSEADKEVMSGKLKDIIKKSADRAQKNNSWGSVSSSTKSQIMAALSQKVDWKKTLAYFCGTKQKSNKSKTFRRINRKYPYIHPGVKVKRTSSLAVYIDQSGSVGSDGLEAFFSALNKLAKHTEFKVFHFDTKVDAESEYVWRKGKNYRDPMRTLTGGTCFNCVEDHFRSRAAEFDGYIVMTDGEAPKPKTCKSKRCWVLLPGCDLYFEKEKRDAIVKMEY